MNESDLIMWEHSSAGRASALQAEGHRFEPYRPHFKKIRMDSRVANGDRLSTCCKLLRWFESTSIHLIILLNIHYKRSKHADVAQLAEQLICNQQVIGSSPIIGLISIEIINFISRDGAVWKLVGLITRRSQVQILLPQFTQVYCV